MSEVVEPIGIVAFTLKFRAQLQTVPGGANTCRVMTLLCVATFMPSFTW